MFKKNALVFRLAQLQEFVGWNRPPPFVFACSGFLGQVLGCLGCKSTVCANRVATNGTSTLGQLGHHRTQHRNGEEDQTESPFGQHGSDYRGKDLLDALAQGRFTQNYFQLLDGILRSHSNSMHHGMKMIFLRHAGDACAN